VVSFTSARIIASAHAIIGYPWLRLKDVLLAAIVLWTDHHKNTWQFGVGLVGGVILSVGPMLFGLSLIGLGALPP
jgi:hypothetical protein